MAGAGLAGDGGFYPESAALEQFYCCVMFLLPFVKIAGQAGAISFISIFFTRSGT